MSPSAPIRICHIVTRLAVRGVPRQVLDIAEGLDRDRFQVSVLTGHSEPDEGDLWDEARQRGIDVTRIEALRRPVNWRRDGAALFQIYQYLRHHPCDIVHTHIAKAGLLGRLAARLVDIPSVLHTYHGVPNEWIGDRVSARCFVGLERWAAARTDVLVAVSESVRREMNAMHVGSTSCWRVIRNGVSSLFLSEPPSDAAERSGAQLLAVGSLTQEKGYDVLLRALPTIASSHPEVELVLIGDGPLKSSLQMLANDLGIASRVQFAGVVADVRPWLRKATLLVAPSLNEGLGMAVVEAMAMGCPVVASKVGGLVEVVVHGETGFLVQPGSVPPLANQVIDLLNSPERRARLGLEGRRHAQAHFARDRPIAQLQDIYETLYRKSAKR
ncbi:MAG: glycosyltransferase family 4 protein [Candidatus Latescibacterota bacterium]